jgi:hypothetical protein
MASEGKVMRFKLRDGAGPHYEPNPKFDPKEPESDENYRDQEYNKPGQIVKSRRQLDKIFVNKFEPLDTVDRTNFQSGGGDEIRSDDPERDRPVRDYEAARVNASDRHLTEDEMEDRPDLKKLAKGRKVEAEEEDEEESGEEGAESDEREDVTDDFDGAKDGGLKVFKTGDKFHVHEVGEEEAMTGSKKGFTNKTDVKKFIKKNVKSE